MSTKLPFPEIPLPLRGPARTIVLVLAILAAPLPPARAQWMDEAARQRAARAVEQCDSVVFVRCAPTPARDKAKAAHLQRESDRRSFGHRAEAGGDSALWDEILIYGEPLSDAKEKRLERMREEIRNSYIPTCGSSEAMDKYSGGGLLAPLLLGFAAASGQCR